MPKSRDDFYRDVRRMVGLSHDALLTDVFPPSDPHNDGARILRRGLAVSAFSLLEGYLEERLTELADELGGCTLRYSDFDERLRKFLTLDAISGLSTRIAFENKASRQTVAERYLGLIAGYANNPPSYTAFGFSPKGTNVASSDISSVLKAFGSEQGWSKLAAIAQAIGSTRVSLINDYENLAQARHSAAHNSSINIPTGDLQTHLETVIVVGIAFDILMTSLVMAHLQARSSAALPVRLSNITHSIRFLDESANGRWVERRNAAGRAVKVYNSEDDGRRGCAGRASRDFTVVINARMLPIELL